MESESRLLVVTGEGVATGTPDHCIMRLVLITTADTPAAALDEVSDIANRTVATLREHGVGAPDIQTTNLAVHEGFDRSDKRIKTGHQAALELRVETLSIEQTAPLLSAVAEVAGDAFRVQGFHLAIRDRALLEETARREAMVDAAARAHQLAEAGGLTLGRILDVVEGDVPRRRGHGAFSARPMSGGGSIPVEPGEVVSTVVVTVAYAIED
jgi:uncharacterized protein YggE